MASMGRLFFAASLIAFGVLQLVYGDFVPGRAPEWPASSGRLVWAYVTGAFFAAAGAAIILGIKARWAAVASGLLIFAWAVLRNLPVAVASTGYGLAWASLGKSLTLFGGAFAVAGSLARPTAFLLVGRVCLGAFLISSGIQHFLFPEFVAQLVPAWIPGAVFWTYFAAVALIAGGVGLILPPTTRWAGALTGLMVFLWLMMLHIPRAVAAATPAARRNEWTAVFEALAVSGIAFVLAATASAGTLGRR
jgi:uncharacterized membrane protein YphA (DoxX/SURF4 family)